MTAINERTAINRYLGRYDPGAFMLKIVIKVAMIMFFYFLMGFFVPIKYEVLTWLFSYLSYSASMCILGNERDRKEIFLYFTAVFIVIASVSYYLNKSALLAGLFIIAVAYAACYIRSVDQKFKLFSIYTIIVCSIATLNNPIKPSSLLEFIISIAAVGTCFFIAVINYRYNVDTLLKGLVKFSHVNISSNFKQIMLDISYGSDIRKDILAVQSARRKDCQIITNKGNTLIYDSTLSNKWSIICRTMMRLQHLSFQMLFYYQTLNLERSRATIQFIKNSTMVDILNKVPPIMLGVFGLNEEAFNDLIKEFGVEVAFLEKEIVINALQLKNNLAMTYEILISLGAIINILKDLRVLVDDLP